MVPNVDEPGLQTEEEKVATIQALTRIVDSEIHRCIYLAMDFMVFLITNSLYDARGRCLVLNLASSLNCTREDIFSIEYEIATILNEFQRNASSEAPAPVEPVLTAADKANAKKAKFYRYLKIGVVSVTAGALIGITGGLAAPAIIGAMVGLSGVVLGSSAALATGSYLSVGLIATMFGSAGAGLAGYKMANRTRGLTEFEFEKYFDGNRLSVMIMVSGWMQDAEDYKRAFGVIPTNLTLEEFAERYQKHAAAQSTQAIANNSVNATVATSVCFETQETSDVSSVSATSVAEAEVASNAKTTEEDITKLFEKYNETKIAPNEIQHPNGSAADIKLSVRIFLQHLLEVSLLLSRQTKNNVVNSNNATNSAMNATDDTSVLVDKVIELLEELRLRDKERGEIFDRDTYGYLRNPESQLNRDDITNSIEFESFQLDSNFQKTTLSLDGESSITSKPNTNQGKLTSGKIVSHWDWAELDISNVYELYLLKWESDVQLKLGTQIARFMLYLEGEVIQNVVASMFFAALASAVFVPAIVASASTSWIDSTWTVAIIRADLAGKELARALLARKGDKDNRPVTLVGFSIGSRVIFSCLKALHKFRNKGRSTAGEVKETLVSNPSEVEVAESSSIEISDEAAQMALNFRGKQSQVQAESRSILRPIEFFTKPIQSKDETPNNSNAAPANLNFSTSWDAASNIPADNNIEVMELSVESEVAKLDDEGSTVPQSKTTSNKNSDVNEKSSDILKTFPDESMCQYIDGLIQDVVLLGSPISSTNPQWRNCCELVNGRFVNGFSKNDLMLGVIYRCSRVQVNVAGLTEVNISSLGNKQIENIDLSYLVKRHVDYCNNMKIILQDLNLAKVS